MILDDLKDKVGEVLNQIRSQVEESDSYNQLRDKYEALPPLAQVGVSITSGLLVLGLLIQLPLSFYQSSSDYLSMVDENRDLILDLYQVKRESALLPQSNQFLNPSEIENQARGFVSAARIQDSQLESIMPIDTASLGSNLIPKSLLQTGIEIRLKNLNLTQIVDYGHQLGRLGSSVFISGLEVRPGTEKGNYFDARFRVFSFSLKTSDGLKSDSKATDQKSSRKGGK